LVETDAAWRLAWDRHPNAQADRAIAAAVAARLQSGREEEVRPPVRH